MSRLEKLLRPIGLGGIARSRSYRALRDPAWTFAPAAIASRSELRALHNSQAGADGFIIGTGPSILKTDFSLIGGRPTIGLNRLFLGFDQFGLVPDFLVCVNLMMIKQSAGALSRLPCPLIASWAGREHLPEAENAIYVRTVDDTRFSHQLMDTASTGGTVTYLALQFAFWLGWQSVTLLGIDHNYRLDTHEQEIGPHGEAVRIRPDDNHFNAEYMPEGTSWQVPDLEQSEQAYRNARTAFEAAGRAVRDGTVGGRLGIFERSLTDYRRQEVVVEEQGG